MILILKAVLGIFYFFFLPGLLMTYYIFKKKELNILERIGISIGLSVVVVPLLMFFGLVILKIPVSEMNVFLETSALILLLFILLIYRNKELVLHHRVSRK